MVLYTRPPENQAVSDTPSLATKDEQNLSGLEACHVNRSFTAIPLLSLVSEKFNLLAMCGSVQ